MAWPDDLLSEGGQIIMPRQDETIRGDGRRQRMDSQDTHQ